MPRMRVDTLCAVEGKHMTKYPKSGVCFECKREGRAWIMRFQDLHQVGHILLCSLHFDKETREDSDEIKNRL